MTERHFDRRGVLRLPRLVVDNRRVGRQACGSALIEQQPHQRQAGTGSITQSWCHDGKGERSRAKVVHRVNLSAMLYEQARKLQVPLRRRNVQRGLATVRRRLLLGPCRRDPGLALVRVGFCCDKGLDDARRIHGSGEYGCVERPRFRPARVGTPGEH